MPQLDILSSNITKVMAAPCSVVAPCYKVFMQLSNLSLAPTTAQDPDVDLVWLTQWFVPSNTDPNGGKNFHAYAESTNGGALQCFVGENAIQLVGGGGVLVYPPTTTLPAANCQSTLGPNGNITIYVPLANVVEAAPIDDRLHEVTASTMTLQAPANSVPSFGGIGGSFFNLIDVAQGYTFDPILVGAVSRKNHGSPGTFDIDLLPPAPGIESRSGGSNGDFQIVVTFATPVTFNSATVSGTGSVSAALASGNQVFVNLTGVTNAQRITLTLIGVNDGSHIANVSVQMGVLLGDVDASGRVDSTDVFQVRQQSLQNANSSNFRTDVDESGRIDSTDVFMTRQQTLTSLP
jgi:hypothetical protein